VSSIDWVNFKAKRNKPFFSKFLLFKKQTGQFSLFGAIQPL